MTKKAQFVWNGLAFGAAAFWIVQGIRWRRGMRRVPNLSPAPPLKNLNKIDRHLAIIVPACNEERTVTAGVGSLLAHAPEDALVVAVDDRSTDGTGAALDRLAAVNPRLHVLHIRRLPRGWLGKTHALQAGTRHARRLWMRAAKGSPDIFRRKHGWYLFTDADVVYADGGIEAAVSHAERRGLDHLVLIPRLDVRGFWEKTFTSAFMFMFSLRYRIWEVNNPKSSAAVGIGAFNLVRASAYERMGTHRAVALEVADDVRLGEEMRRSGARQEVAAGTEIACVRWQHSLWGLIAGLEKNGFAGVEYSLPRLAAATVGMALIMQPYIGIFFAPRQGKAANAATLAMIASIYRESEERGGPSWLYFATFPLGVMLFVLTLWRSAALALARGGVVWRDTFYSLPELRRRAIPEAIPEAAVSTEEDSAGKPLQ